MNKKMTAFKYLLMMLGFVICSTVFCVCNLSTKQDVYATDNVIVVTIGDKTSIYGEEISLSDVICTTNNENVSIEELNITLNSKALTEKTAGTYEITGTSENTNYEVEFIGGTYTIEKRQIEIKTEQQSEYGDEIVIDNTNYEIVNGTIVDFDKDLGITYSTTATSESPVGDYPMIMISTNTNYRIVLTSGVYKIVKKKLTITIGNKTSTYGDELTLEDVALTVDSLVDIENMQVKLFSNALTEKIVGVYDINATIENENYDATVINGTYQIIKRVVKITTEQSSVYGETHIIDNNNFKVIYGSIVNNDQLGLKFSTTATKTSNAGKYEITLVSYNNTNYDFILTSGILIVEQRKVVFIINNKSSTYGDIIVSLTFAMKSGYSLANFNKIEDLNIKLITPVNSSSPVIEGGYEISAIYNNSNYSATFENGIYTILPRSIVVKINNANTEYGEDLDSLTFEVKDSLVGEDTKEDLNIVLSTTATKYSDVNENGYPITATYNNKNYIIVFDEGTYTITPLNIEILINKQNVGYGDNIYLDNNDYEILSETEFTKEDLNIVLSTNAEKGNNIGDYIITATSTNKNFKLVFEEGVLKINKRRLVIKMNDIKVKRYFEFDVTDGTYQIVEGSVADVGDFEIRTQTNANWFSFGNNYYITATCNNPNYDLEVIKGKVTMQVSASDIGIILFIVVVVALIIIFIFTYKKRKEKEQKRFKDLYKELKQNT